MLTVIIFIALLAVLVLAHEFGHFYTAIKTGMQVDEFGFGFPPRAWSFIKNGVRYSINWLPLGGFVKIKGEDGSKRDEVGSFSSKKPWQRVLVLSAGVIMNLILAAVLLSVGFMFGLPQAIDGLTNENIRDRKVQIVSVLPDSPAAKADLKLGDEVVSFNGEKITTVEQLISLTSSAIDTNVKIKIKRGQEELEKEIGVIKLEETGKGGVGIGLLATGVVKYGFFTSIVKGVAATATMTWAIILGFLGMIKNLFTTGSVGVDVSGPVGIAVMTGQIAQLGFAYLIQFAAMLSVNLAVINFLPFPALDGGRVLFVIIEKLRGKPMNDKTEGIAHAIGFLLLMLLIVFVTFKDIVRMFN